MVIYYFHKVLYVGERASNAVLCLVKWGGGGVEGGFDRLYIYGLNRFRICS